MRDWIDIWVIFLKEDLKISNICKLAREGLMAQITNTELFSNELVNYFLGQAIPFKISCTDPAQVAVLKKIINAIHTLEEMLSQLEALDIRQDRYTAAISADAVKLGYSATHAFYGALQLLNHSSADVQRIVGPHLTRLSQKMGVVAASLKQFTPNHLEQSSGLALAGAIQMLPTHARDEKAVFASVSHLIYELPRYFGQLQALIATHASTMISNPHRSRAEHDAAVAQKKRDLLASFEQVAGATDASILVHNRSILSKLARRLLVRAVF